MLVGVALHGARFTDYEDESRGVSILLPRTQFPVSSDNVMLERSQ